MMNIKSYHPVSAVCPGFKSQIDCLLKGSQNDHLQVHAFCFLGFNNRGCLKFQKAQFSSHCTFLHHLLPYLKSSVFAPFSDSLSPVWRVQDSSSLLSEMCQTRHYSVIQKICCVAVSNRRKRKKKYELHLCSSGAETCAGQNNYFVRTLGSRCKDVQFNMIFFYIFMYYI